MDARRSDNLVEEKETVSDYRVLAWSGSLVLASALGLWALFAFALQPLLVLDPAQSLGLGETAASFAALAPIVILTIRWRGGPIRRRGDLPGELAVTFGLAGLVGLLATTARSNDFVLQERAIGIALAGPAFVIAVAMVLRLLLRQTLLPPGRPFPPAEGAGRPHRWPTTGALTIRPSLMATMLVVALVSGSLIAAHARSGVVAREEHLAAQHLRDLLEVVRAQSRALQPHQLARLWQSLPPNPEGSPVLLARGRVIVGSTAGVELGAHLSEGEGRTCRSGSKRWRCLAANGPAGRRLVVLQSVDLPRRSADLARLDRVLVIAGLGVFLVAAFVGWLVGADATADLQVITAQLRAMATGDRLDLRRQLTVTSTDEVGDLTAAVGRLRLRLEHEIESYDASLQQTRAAEQIKTQFVADVSHELRTPLSTLCGHAQLLLEGFEGPLTAQQADDVRVIHNGGRQLLGLINDVLDMSVIKSGRLKLNCEPLDLGALCSEVVDQHQGALRSRARADVALRYEIEEDLPDLRADPRRLRQVLQNLVSNALKFTQEGHVTVQVSRGDERHLRLVVDDSGVGISAVDLPHVFEEYRQAGTAVARRKGSGLGLAIARRLVEAHGGTISVESDVGCGSRFTVDLPLEAPTTAGGQR